MPMLLYYLLPLQLLLAGWLPTLALQGKDGSADNREGHPWKDKTRPRPRVQGVGGIFEQDSGQSRRLSFILCCFV